jgi:hypothetical protein
VSGPTGKPSGTRRLAAIIAILMVAAVAVGTLIRIVDDPVRVLAELVLLVVLAAAGWIALTRTDTSALEAHRTHAAHG